MDRMTDGTLKAVAKVFDGAKSAENSLRIYALHQDGSREERLLLKRDVESHLSNVLRAVESNGPFFKEMDFEKFKAVMKIAGRRVDAVSIPPGFEDSPKSTLESVLRNARNWHEHPEQAGSHEKKSERDNERDRYIADGLGMELIVELFNSISSLLNSVLRQLDKKELCALYAYCDRTRSELFCWQQEVIQAIKTEGGLFAEHPKLLEQARSFLEFQPNPNNIHIIHEEGETPEVNG